MVLSPDYPNIFAITDLFGISLSQVYPMKYLFCSKVCLKPCSKLWTACSKVCRKRAGLSKTARVLHRTSGLSKVLHRDLFKTFIPTNPNLTIRLGYASGSTCDITEWLVIYNPHYATHDKVLNSLNSPTTATIFLLHYPGNAQGIQMRHQPNVIAQRTKGVIH